MDLQLAKEAVINALRDRARKMQRDASPIMGGGAREDIQLMRKFFSEADWAKAVQMIRKGATPAAAAAALGYSLSAMAEEDQR